MKFILLLSLIGLIHCYRFHYTSSRACDHVFFSNTSEFYYHQKKINTVINNDMFNINSYDENKFYFLNNTSKLTNYLIENNIIINSDVINGYIYNYIYKHDYKKYCMYEDIMNTSEIKLKKTNYNFYYEPSWFYDYMMYFDELLYDSYINNKAINIVDIIYIDNDGYDLYHNILYKYIVKIKDEYYAIKPYDNKTNIFEEIKETKFNIYEFIIEHFVYILILFLGIILL